jgi:hypothetical protein
LTIARTAIAVPPIAFNCSKQLITAYCSYVK